MNHYELLGLPPSASPGLIRASFEVRVQKLAQQPVAPGEPTLAQLNRAYAVLSDAAMRAAYDREIAHDPSPAGRAATAGADRAGGDGDGPTGGAAAGFWRRAAAWLVDALVLAVTGAVLSAALALGLGRVEGSSPRAALMNVLVAWLVVPLAYHTLCLASRLGATPGRYLAGVRVVGASHGGRIGVGSSLVRAVVSYVSKFFILPDLVQLVTARRQSLADLAAQTVVVNTGEASPRAVAAVGIGAVVCAVGCGAVLAYLSAPLVRDYATQAQGLVVLEQMIEVSQRVEAHYRSTGKVETSLAELGYTARFPGVVIRIEANGVIHAAVPNRAGGSLGTLILVPSETAGAARLTWTCMQAEFSSQNLVPPPCRTPYPAPPG